MALEWIQDRSDFSWSAEDADGVVFRATRYQQMTDRLMAYRNALMWTFDRISVDGGMTPKEQRQAMEEIAKVLTGRPSPAASYQPNEWDDSAGLPIATAGDAEQSGTHLEQGSKS